MFKIVGAGFEATSMVVVCGSDTQTLSLGSSLGNVERKENITCLLTWGLIVVLQPTSIHCNEDWLLDVQMIADGIHEQMGVEILEGVGDWQGYRQLLGISSRSFPTSQGHPLSWP